jgi:BASS family bile acid:Na+ symporter
MDAQTIVNLFIPFTLMVIMFSMGLGLTVKDFKLVLVHPKAVVAGSLAQLVLLPLLGFLVAWLFAPSPAMAVGLVLITACPGGPSSNLMTNLARGDTALSVSLTAISGVVTIASIPLITNFAAGVFAADAAGLSLPVGSTVLKLILIVALPLAVGMLVRWKRPVFAARIETWVKRAAVTLLAILIIGALIKSRKELALYGFDAIYPPMLLSILGVVFGLALSFSLKLSPRQRVAIPIEVGTQNGALAIGLALTAMESTDAAFPGVIYGTFMYLPCAVMVLFGRRYLASVDALDAR